MGVIYFKQLEGFASGAYVITYSKYVNIKAIHAYPYHVFSLNGPLKLKLFDLLYCSLHILPQILNLQ